MNSDQSPYATPLSLSNQSQNLFRSGQNMTSDIHQNNQLNYFNNNFALNSQQFLTQNQINSSDLKSLEPLTPNYYYSNKNFGVNSLNTAMLSPESIGGQTPSLSDMTPNIPQTNTHHLNNYTNMHPNILSNTGMLSPESLCGQTPIITDSTMSLKSAHNLNYSADLSNNMISNSTYSNYNNQQTEWSNNNSMCNMIPQMQNIDYKTNYNLMYNESAQYLQQHQQQQSLMNNIYNNTNQYNNCFNAN